MKFTEKTRALIQERAKNRCELCGAVAFAHQIHHRRPRGMGGSKSHLTGGAANGIWVHPACHAKIESNRQEALENGWLVYQTRIPSETPFKRYDGWFLLADNGTMTTYDGPI